MIEYVSMISASVISYFFSYSFDIHVPPLSLSAPFFLSLIYDLLSCVYHYKMTVEV